MSTDLATFNPFDPTVLQCPFPHYAQMREEAPVLRLDHLGGLYLVTRHDLVLEVVRDPQLYSSQFGGASMPMPAEDRAKMAEVMREGYPRVPTMLTADQPDHTRYRRLVAKAFSPRAIADLEPEIRRITTELLDAIVAKAAAAGGTASVEFVEEFAVPLPVRVIAKALNVPDERLADFKRWSDDSIAGIGTQLDIDGRVAAERGVNEFQHYFAEQLERRRTEPQDDLLTNLLNARIDDDDPDVTDRRPLDMPEMLSIVQQLLVAGNETTTKMLTEMMRLLGEHPDQWDAVRADPDRVDRIVEETLRLSTPTQGMFRIVTRDTELGGVPLPEGSRIVIVFSSANRDESVFPHPDEFDPDRDHVRDHLAFGKGIHYCLGANLSRLEGRIALQELAARIESFRLADDNQYGYFPSFMLRGLTSLTLEMTPATVTA
ncbi:MAG: cytochrome P450 [Ilumatobacteraceae bacterium]|jgi:cytochrome P450|nr:cytochrome P450 [Ilumatobacteraceae bacterium]